MTGALLLSDGSASAPALSNDGDSNTGIFFPAADTIAFSEGGVEAMRLDSSGRVTMPYQPAFTAFLSSSTSVSSGVQKINLNSKDVDIGSNFNTSTGRFTAPVSGQYLFNAIVGVDATTASIIYLSAEIWKNGTRLVWSG
jgi:hypothetical protein